MHRLQLLSLKSPLGFTICLSLTLKLPPPPSTSHIVRNVHDTVKSAEGIIDFKLDPGESIAFPSICCAFVFVFASVHVDATMPLMSRVEIARPGAGLVVPLPGPCCAITATLADVGGNSG